MRRDAKIDQVEELIMPVLRGGDLELVDIELRREAVGMVLRILLDGTAGAVGIDDLATASKDIGRLLDETGLIERKFTLEVSSPGIERPLTKPEHFIRFVGSKVSVKTEQAIDKRKNFTGRLIEAGDSDFVVETDGAKFEIAYDNVATARLRVDIEF
ncbi:MAG: ribosome maturation factor RimP [Actinobacteria bacterium]|nr:ribosome maturation factor RimP [Actinomycetota bacterium]